MKLKYGTEQEHLSTIARAKAKGIDNIWTGDIARNAYLQENLEYAEQKGFVKVTFEDSYDDESSYYKLEWL